MFPGSILFLGFSEFTGQCHKEMPQRYDIQPDIPVKPPARLPRTNQLATMAGRGDPGVDQLPAGQDFQLLLGIADHDKTTVFSDFLDAMQNITAIFSGVKDDISLFERTIRKVQIGHVATVKKWNHAATGDGDGHVLLSLS